MVVYCVGLRKSAIACQIHQEGLQRLIMRASQLRT